MVGEQKIRSFRISGDQKDAWLPGTVSIGRYRSSFNLIFEASRSFKVNGAIAVDDIEFTSNL
jgi:hypothetical protein